MLSPRVAEVESGNFRMGFLQNFVGGKKEISLWKAFIIIDF